MKLVFSKHAWDDYLYWQNADKEIVKRLNTLIRGIERTPCQGQGKPKPLNHSLSGYWARRITDEHRLVYKVENDAVAIAQLRHHY